MGWDPQGQQTAAIGKNDEKKEKKGPRDVV
jgi:hypothetical protein